MKLVKLASPYQLYISSDNLLVEDATSGACNTSNLVIQSRSTPLVARAGKFDKIFPRGECIVWKI